MLIRPKGSILTLARSIFPLASSSSQCPWPNRSAVGLQPPTETLCVKFVSLKTTGPFTLLKQESS